VHNKFVVDGLRDKGAVFVEELEEIPAEDRECPVIFSAHGVPKSVPEDAASRKMFFLDATCPLVSKVHKEAEIHDRRDREIVLIGHQGHPEVIGTMGQLPDGTVSLIETEDDAWAFQPKTDRQLAFLTQTTLSVDDTAGIVRVLKERFPDIVAPHKEDICYATTNRQEAVKEVAPQVDAMIVVGAPNSSNSQRLREVAERAGCRVSHLIQRAAEIDWAAFEGISTLGLTAGASAPETLVEEIIAAFSDHYTVKVEIVRTAEETISFNLPRELRDFAQQARDAAE
ncbi:MAG: 4-hydroxy-3-methylbut-2-enyl diphosphate reductase, partial [Rhodobacteraceae bacterium]|nr:4-hydroxy-3-methylbut-2-enyl diphosphate reductase [Paracoccaceae bacterium]